MARRWTSGAESGAALSEGATLTVTTTGTLAFGTSTVHLPGKRAFQFSTGGSNGTSFIVPTAGLATASLHHVYSRAWVNFPQKAAACAFMSFHNGTSNVIYARFETTGVITLWNATGTPAQIGSGTAGDMSNGWHRVELHCMVNSAGGATGAADLWVDGVLIATTTTANFGTTLISNARFGWCASTSLPGNNVIINIDDIAINDDSGTAQTGQVGDGYVLDLVPTADSAIGNWLEGTTATTSLWDAVNNQPPVGVAPTPANGTLEQIQDANSSTTDPGAAYDATLQTYTAAGVRTNDTLNLALMVAVVGVSTAASQNATLTGVSNPAIAQSANQATPAVIAGTFPTNWGFIASDQIAYAPTPTLGTAPVGRIHKASASTAQLDVCYMALRIDVKPVNIRTITTLIATLRTSSRNVPTTIATKKTSSRTVSTAMAALATLSRTVTTVIATLLSGNSRTIATTVAALHSYSRTVTTTVASLSTRSRVIATTIATFLPPPPKPGTVGLSDTPLHTVGLTDTGIDSVGPIDHT